MGIKLNKYQTFFAQNIISWLISIIPIVLIFSNAIADIIIVVVSLFFLFSCVKENNWLWLNEPWIKICLISYLWLIISSFFAYDETLALSRSIGWIRFVIFAASLQFLFLNKKKNRNRIIACTIVSLIYVNLEMFLEYFTGSSFYRTFRVTFFDIDGYGGAGRIAGPFKDSPKSGIFLAYFLFPTLLGIYTFIKNKFSSFYSILFIILFLFINLFLTYVSGHRASMLSVLISLSLIICYLIFKNKKYKILFLLIFLIPSIIFFTQNFGNQYNFKKNVIEKTINEIKDYSESAYGSLSLTALKMFKSNPVFGIGLKNYRIVCEKDEFLSKGHLGTGYGVSPWKGHYNIGLKKYYEATCSSHPHNLYLTLLSETGLPGFLFFLFFLLVITIKILKNKKILLNQVIFIGILVTLIPKLLPMMPSLNFFSNWNSICFWFLIGWLFSFFPRNKKLQ